MSSEHDLVSCQNYVSNLHVRKRASASQTIAAVCWLYMLALAISAYNHSDPEILGVLPLDVVTMMASLRLPMKQFPLSESREIGTSLTEYCELLTTEVNWMPLKEEFR